MSLFRARPVLERRDFTSSNSIPLNSAGYANTSGVYVSTDTALRLAAVFGSVSLIADALSTTPIATFRKRSDGTREMIDTPSLLDRPSGTMERVEWLTALFASLLLRGNAYGIKDSFDLGGYPTQIHLVHPDDVSVTRSNDGMPVYRFGTEVMPLRMVFHVKGFCLPGELCGLSPVANFAQTIGAGLASEDFGARFYGEGGHPTAVLQTEQQVTQEQAEAIKARLMNAIRGRREPIVLGAGTEWKPIQVPPNESMFLESSKFSALQIATMIFHVPASMIGIAVEGSSLTYSNREQDEIAFQTRALLHWAVRFEQHISRQLPRSQYVKFNMDAAVRVDLASRYAAHKVGIDGGFLLKDEARELEDRPPLTPAQMAAQKPPMPPPPAPPKEAPPNA